MNVSMQDTYNLGWKLAAVLQGRSPASLLDTYSQERKVIAEDLIAMDTRWSKAIGGAGRVDSHDAKAVQAAFAEVQRQFVTNGEFTAGMATHYPPGAAHRRRTPTCTWRPASRRDDVSSPRRWCGSAMPRRCTSGTPPSRRRPLAPLRLRRRRRPPLQRFAAARSSWTSCAARTRRCIATRPTGGTPTGSSMCAPSSSSRTYDSTGRTCTSCSSHARAGHGLIDYEKVFTPGLDGDGDIFDLRGIDRGLGALVVVRPDQYVSLVLPLDGYEELNKFFDGS